MWFLLLCHSPLGHIQYLDYERRFKDFPCKKQQTPEKVTPRLIDLISRLLIKQSMPPTFWLWFLHHV